MSEEHKKEGFSYTSPEKQRKNALLVLILEFVIGGVALISIFIFLNYINVLPYKKLIIEKASSSNLFGFFSNPNDNLVDISPTPAIDKAKVPFLMCPISEVKCGQAEIVEGTIIGLRYKKIEQGTRLINVGSGQLAFSSKVDRQGISLTMEERGIRVNYELTGFKQSTNSASIGEGVELGVFNGQDSSLLFSVQSTVTKKYIKVLPYKNKYLTIDEGL